MGSTGHGSFASRHSERISDDTFGIVGAVAYKGQIDPKSGLDKVGANKVTLKASATNGDNVLFQFKLSKDSSLMTIVGYQDGIPEVKCKVAVDSGQPSLDKVIASGSSTQKVQATKLKTLFSQSVDVKEDDLGSIANSLLKKKKVREGDR